MRERREGGRGGMGEGGREKGEESRKTRKKHHSPHVREDQHKLTWFYSALERNTIKHLLSTIVYCSFKQQRTVHFSSQYIVQEGQFFRRKITEVYVFALSCIYMYVHVYTFVYTLTQTSLVRNIFDLLNFPSLFVLPCNFTL